MPGKPTPEDVLQSMVDHLASCGNNVSEASRTWIDERINSTIPRPTFQHRIEEARRRGVSSKVEIRKPPLVLKGQSILYDKDGNQSGRWDKSKLQGREPEDVTQLPDPKKIVKLSTLYDQEGRVSQQWISEKPDDIEREKLWLAFAQGLAADLPRAEPVAAPEFSHADRLACYPVGDHHTGMMAWPAETGGDAYDLKIAEQIIREAALRLIGTCPPCKQAVLGFLGDFFHYDSYAAVTPAHKNLLDADGRYPKMVEVGIRIIRHLITAALERHEHVTVIFKGGNHDPSTSACIRIFLACLYENEPRVTIDTSPMDYSYFEFGKVLLGFHHGDKAKAAQLPGIMAHDRPEEWGRTEFRLWLTGHLHKEARSEFPGCSVETIPVLAPLDAYAAGAGYRSKQQMKAIVFHREHGEVERHTVNPGMFERRAA